MVAEPPIVDPSSTESTTFNLLCDDFCQSRGATSTEKWSQVAQKVVDTLKKAKLKHSCDFKDLSYWKSFGVSHPLPQIADVIARTSSTAPGYKWIPPQNAQISANKIGDMSVSGRNVVDVFVQMPDGIFGKRDFINVVYPVKRAHYMCSSSVALKSALSGLELSWTANSTLADADFVFPNLLITERRVPGSVCVHFYASEEALAKMSRFSPSSGNLRPATVNPKYTGEADVATPIYNQRILLNMREESLNRRIQERFQGIDAILKALRLIDAWFAARGFTKFHPLFHASFLMSLLKQDETLEKQTVVSIVRAYFTAFVAWTAEEGRGLWEEVDADILAAHTAAFPAVLLDDTGYLNLAFGFTSDEIAKAKSEISLSLPLLGESSRFDTLFLNNQHFYDMYDEYLRFSVNPKEFAALSANIAVDVVDSFDIKRSLQKTLSEMVHNGLDERFDYFGIHNEEKTSEQWSVSSVLSPSDSLSVLLGFKISKQWTNPITVGPVANEPSAKQFRAFWHGATTLRKFADTRVCECMVWGDGPDASIPAKVLRFLVNKNFGLGEGAVSWRSKFYDAREEKEHKTDINSAFSSLSSILRSLKNIPLLITNIHGVSPFLRGTEPHSGQTVATDGEGSIVDGHHQPSTHKVPKFTPSVEVFIKMEYSGKWGNDVAAIRKLSAAFYLQIAEQLRKVHKLLAVATETDIYVVKDKIVFKLTIVNDKVHKLLEDRVNTLKTTGATRIESTAEGKTLAAFQKTYVSEMLLQASLHSFSLKSPFFSAAVQLMKLWLASHQLSGSIHDLALEMIVAAALDTPGLPVASSAVAAFRRCLQLISRHNWSARPLIVDFDNAWNEDVIAKIEANFVKMRPVLPPIVIICNEDSVGTKWTRDCPSPLLLKRIIGLAGNALRIVDESLSKTAAIDLLGSLLQTDFSLYDAVINLHPKYITRSHQTPSHKEEPKNLPVVDFDPIADFVKVAENSFGSSVVFFYNKYGGSKIGLKFKPNEEEVPAKISRCHLHFSVSRDRLQLNREEIFESLELIGKGLVKDVTRHF